MSPLVSVVVPAFNAEAYLAEALGSIAAQGVDVETFVVDDGSSDGTAAVVADHSGVMLITHGVNRGIAAARNSGVRKAQGEYLAFLDADDVWPPGSLSARLAALQTEQQYDGVFGQVVQFGADLEETVPAPGALAGSMLIRRAAFKRVGGFDEQLGIGEFLDWYARAEDAGVVFRHIPEVVLRRRIHATNTMRTAATVEYTRVLRAALARRRGEQ